MGGSIGKDRLTTTNAAVPIDTDVFATLTKEQMAGKTQAQILKMFDDEIDGKLERPKEVFTPPVSHPADSREIKAARNLRCLVLQ